MIRDIIVILSIWYNFKHTLSVSTKKNSNIFFFYIKRLFAIILVLAKIYVLYFQQNIGVINQRIEFNGLMSFIKDELFRRTKV